MLSNEQRAHDLAIYSLQFKMTEHLQNAENNTTAFDVFKAYKEIYETALTACNKHFPQENE